MRIEIYHYEDIRNGNEWKVDYDSKMRSFRLWKFDKVKAMWAIYDEMDDRYMTEMWLEGLRTPFNLKGDDI